jgi:electron transfer flavoprotein beta subunit
VKIAVCVKEVPTSTAGRSIDAATGRLVRDGDQGLNAFDAHAIEAALQLREAGGDAADATVTAVCMGPAGATRTLQKALALGADDAVLITDEQLQGSDILATARVLAASLRMGGYDLVLLGQQAGDSDCWALPGVVAELLEMPVATQASKLALAGGEASIERQTEAGYEKLSLTTPAVISVSDALNTPRYPSLKAIMGAKKKPVQTLGLADLGLDASLVGQGGSRTTVLALDAPPSKESGIKIEDDGSAADKIVEFLSARSLL